MQRLDTGQNSGKFHHFVQKKCAIWKIVSPSVVAQPSAQGGGVPLVGWVLPLVLSLVQGGNPGRLPTPWAGFGETVEKKTQKTVKQVKACKQGGKCASPSSKKKRKNAQEKCTKPQKHTNSPKTCKKMEPKLQYFYGIMRKCQFSKKIQKFVKICKKMAYNGSHVQKAEGQL